LGRDLTIARESLPPRDSQEFPRPAPKCPLTTVGRSSRGHVCFQYHPGPFARQVFPLPPVFPLPFPEQRPDAPFLPPPRVKSQAILRESGSCLSLHPVYTHSFLFFLFPANISFRRALVRRRFPVPASDSEAFLTLLTASAAFSEGRP